MNATDNLDNINISAFEEKVIYVYKHLDVVSHEGWLKVGQTKKSNIIGEGHNLRIIDQHEASNVAYEVLYTTNAVTHDNKIFSDHDIHRELQRYGIEREYTQNPRTNRKSEWFKADIDTVIEVIDRYKSKAQVNSDGVITDFVLRSEQQEAVDVTTQYYTRVLEDSNVQPEFLWNAKPRFGKTLTAYSFAQNIKAKKILILTNRPSIADSWYTDFQRFDFKYTGQNDNKHRWEFTASDSIRRKLRDVEGSKDILTREEQKNRNAIYPNFIHFISLPNIKGTKKDADTYKRENEWIFKSDDGDGIKWDLLIIDESHEGVDTKKAYAVLANVNHNFVLHLSGTPFKALANNKFNSNQIYNWSYTDEQNAKAEWDLEDGNNPYAPLPKLNIFTYKLSRALQIKAEEAKNEGSEYAFELGEFFRVIKVNGTDAFVYEDKVKLFLDNLSSSKYQYPFSNKDFLESLRHTFWMLPGVPQCKLMKQLLKDHPFFKDYTVILAAGDGDEDRLTNSALEEVRAAINGHHNELHPLETKTITLSCGQLTTGVTVPAWTAVLMLQGGKSPSIYMQTAFRAQNPFSIATSGGELYTKENCYIFDFAPDRILQHLAEMADKGSTRTAVTREAKVQELINLLQVFAEDDEGRMYELDANQVLTLPLKLITEEVVSRGFMSNRLFESISGIFGAPQSVMDILNKITPDEKGKQGDNSKNKVSNKPRIWVDNDKNIHINEDIVINTTNGLLGEKQYVEIGSEEEQEVSTIKSNVATELRNKNIPSDSANTIMKELEKKLPKVVAKIPDPIPQPGDPDYHEPEKPDEKPAPKDKTEEEKTRDRLRGFARTIPSFLMAYGDSQTTLHNFDENIPEDVFQDLTSITKEEFRKLRDGFEYESKNEETGQIESRRFEGLFNENVFNASVQEFLQKRAELSDYYLQDRKQDIFEFIPPQATNQIFTPKNVVKMMINNLEEHNPDIFKQTDTTFIDLYMKSGLYITEIVKKLFTNTRSQYSSDMECIKHILEKQVYGLAPTGVLHAITNSLIFGFDDAHIISTKNFAQLDLTPYTKGDKDSSLQEKLYQQFNLDKNMKFTAVVGNPPYHYESGRRKIPIYQHFIMSSKSFAKLASFVTPDGFVKGGQQLEPLRQWLINNQNLKTIEFHKEPIFPTYAVDAAITIFDYTKYYSDPYKKIYDSTGLVKEGYLDWQYRDVIIDENKYKVLKIFEKIIKKENSDISTLIPGWAPFGLNSKCYKENKSNFSLEKTKSKNIKILVCEDGSDYYYINPNDDFSYEGSDGRIEFVKLDNSYMWKVVFPKAGLVNEKPLNTRILGPDIIFTDKFLCIFVKSEQEAINAEKYFNSRFYRAGLDSKMTSWNLYRKWHSNIPLQDFTSQSDIDWSKSIPEIDQQLYKKYGLDQKEIDFIESRIKPMT